MTVPTYEDMIRNMAVGARGILLVVSTLLACSDGGPFSYWPWTTTETHSEGSVMGFEVAASKRACFDHAVALQRSGSVRALQLVDAVRGTYEEKFKGTGLSDADFAVVGESNLWHLGLTGDNAWLLLTFVDDRLALIERKDYRGPTE